LNLTQYKALFIAVTAILALLVASPALQRVLVYPQTEFFTELTLLSPVHTAENYPYNITQNGNYTIFLGVTNQLGACAYYQVEVKFRNETQSAPDDFNQTGSSLPSLYNITAFVANKESLEKPVTFAFDFNYSLINNFGQQQANFNSLTLNGVTLNLQGQSSVWNPQTHEFYGNLVFELWLYNSTIGDFQYNHRFVGLRFNMTSTG
jgi:uncharacterized membrane protein